MVSFDIVSLFTNIPFDETISICSDFVVHQLLSFLFQKIFSLSWWKLPQSLCHLASMKLCIARLTVLVWVLLLAPFWRTFLLGFMKDYCLKSFLSPLRYVDDTFVSFSLRTDALSFFDKLNDLHSALSLTMEEEKSNKLPFLDMQVERCKFSFLTSTGLYLSWDSFAPGLWN